MHHIFSLWEQKHSEKEVMEEFCWVRLLTQELTLIVVV